MVLWGRSGSVTFQTLPPDVPPPVSRRPSGLNAGDPTGASLITLRCFGACGPVVCHNATEPSTPSRPLLALGAARDAYAVG